MNELILYWRLVCLQTKAQLEYRGAFMLMFLAKIVGWGSEFIVVIILFSTFDSIGGWGMYDLLFIHAINIMSYSMISQFLLNPCHKMSAEVRTGTFDSLLTKPVNPFFHYVFRIFSTGYISNITMCLAVLGVVLSRSAFEFSILNVGLLIVTLLGGAFFQGTLYILISITAFKMVKNDAVNSLIYVLRGFIAYPIHIYASPIRILLTFIVPFAFTSYYAALYFLNHGGGMHLIFIGFLIGLFLIIFSYKCWMRALKYYESTGS